SSRGLGGLWTDRSRPRADAAPCLAGEIRGWVGPPPSAMPMSESTGQSLKRELDARTGTLFSAAMIVGTGIFAALGAAADSGGTGVLVAMLHGGTVALATGILAAQLGVNNPEEGGAFTWARAFG